jgi:pilus assembly protein CpaE
MTRLLVIDDESINHQLVAHALESLNFEVHFAENGREGIAVARNIKPDIIITDVMMPEVNGYEFTRMLRRDAQFAATPILVLTAQSGLQDKIKSFEAGADDHLVKPFDSSELIVRVTSLLRRVDATKSSLLSDTARDEAKVIAVHSLRGGIGCSTLAVNLALGLNSLWQKPTILLDLTMTAGQVALMLNMTLRRTWADIARFKATDLDYDAVSSIISKDDNGLSFIAAPTFPAEAEALKGDLLGSALGVIKKHHEYVIADLPHDFSDIAIQALDTADAILLLTSPDMASIRAVAAALDTYQKLGYPKEKIKPVLNSVFPRSSLSKEKIEAALGVAPAVSIPYVQDLFVDAINLGRPPIQHKPNENVSALLEDFSFFMSKDVHRKGKNDNPTPAWKRVYKRYQERRK